MMIIARLVSTVSCLVVLQVFVEDFAGWIGGVSSSKRRPHSSSSCIVHGFLLRQPITTRHRYPSGSLFSRRYSNKNDNGDYEDDDDDLPPEIDERKIKNFKPPTSSFGLGRGRSSPQLRKAMGTSKTSRANVFVCTNCGCESVKWMGRCPTCKEWNTLQEFVVPRSNDSFGGSSSVAQALLGGKTSIGANRISSGDGGLNNNQSWLDGIDTARSSGIDGWIGDELNTMGNRPVSITNINESDDNAQSRKQRIRIPDDDEFTNVLGGGFMPGSLLLLGGDPGVGKSTLALQIASQLALTGTNPVWYVSGEETLGQVAARAERLDAQTIQQLYLFAETNLNHLAELILLEMEKLETGEVDIRTGSSSSSLPSLLIIDSLQTMICDTSSNYATGGVAQVRECMALLLRLAKLSYIPILVIGHVTKSGDVAGPRMVEHMVDAVLYLEHGGNSQNIMNNSYRWLRAVKNRFGSCDTVGLYSFEQTGYLQPSPEAFDLQQQQLDDTEGCAMAIAIEGNQRAMNVEVQALVVTNSLGPDSGGGGSKTTVEGSAGYRTRIQLLLGVLKKHCRISLTQRNQFTSVFVNIISQLSKSKQKTLDPTLDLAVCVAVTSSLIAIPVRGDTAFVAQVGLLGELRTLSNMEIRISQAQRMGFRRVIVAGKYGSNNMKGRKASSSQKQPYYGGDMEVLEFPTLKQALAAGLASPIPPKSYGQRRSKLQSSKSRKKPPPRPSDQYIIMDDEDDDEDEDYFGEEDFQ